MRKSYDAEPRTGRIMVVDDDNHVRSVTVSILEKHGHGVTSFDNGRDALTSFGEGDCDLVLSDVMMPEMDGVELLGHVRERDPSVPVILMTAFADLKVAMNAIKQGAFDLIIKPYDPICLLASVDKGIKYRWLSKREKEHTARLEKALADKTRELRELHGQLIFSDKMATIGQLMAGVAHEINSPIGYVGANLETLAKYSGKLIGLVDYMQSLAERYVPTEALHELREYRNRERLDALIEDWENLISESSEGVERVRKIVLDLKSVSRNNGDAMEVVDINQTLESIISIVWNEIKYVAELRRDFSKTAPVWGSQQRLGQVFLNLLVNASHAIKGQGVITIKTWQAGDRIHVSFTDTGRGIPEDVLPHIFEPFFTTKEPGKGTGLGLSISGDIVKTHGGTIEVRSEPGKGSVFTVTLPARPAS